MKLSDIPNQAKAWIGAFVALVAVAGMLWSWMGLHTDAEAARHVDDFVDYKSLQYKADKFDRVDRVQREIDRIDYELLTTELSQKQKDYLKTKRGDLVKKIECIQKDEC